MRINTLLKKLNLDKVKNNHEIIDIVDESKNCRNNTIFFAIKGERYDGHKLIYEAINHGAKTIFLTDRQEEVKDINYVYCENILDTLAKSLSIIYKDILKSFMFIGVVGTNGKTTTSSVLYEYLSFYNKKAMLIGSNGVFSGCNYYKNDNTTPKITLLYNYLKLAFIIKVKFIVMEVSSIAISKLRVKYIPFDMLIFTNFYSDHLDYHKTLDNYLYCKKIPFISLRHDGIIIANKDDLKYSELLKYAEAEIYSYSIENNSMYKANIIKEDLNGLKFKVLDVEYKSDLLLKFNIYNLLPTIIFSYLSHFGNAYKFIKQYKGPDGRMDKFYVGKKTVIIDYAHTTSAVKNVIDGVLRFATASVYVVIGCGGNRDRTKRAEIGSLLSSSNVFPIITNDNPRNEDENQIIEDIKKGSTKELTVIKDRKSAIYFALDTAKENDIILILGKGQEDYFLKNGTKYHYSDYETINSYKDSIEC